MDEATAAGAGAYSPVNGLGMKSFILIFCYCFLAFTIGALFFTYGAKLIFSFTTGFGI